MNESFGIIAEFSIGLAGFSGVVALIGDAPAKIHRFRVSNIIRTAFTPGFCALFGIFLLHLGLQDQDVIRLTSAVLGLVAFTHWFVSVRVYLNFEASIRSSTAGVASLQISMAALNILAQVFNSFVVTDYAAAILIGGLIQQLLAAAFTFSNIVSSLLNERDNAES